MKKYIKPTYKTEGIETEDVILASWTGVIDMGSGSLTNGDITIEGDKAAFNVLFGNL